MYKIYLTQKLKDALGRVEKTCFVKSRKTLLEKEKKCWEQTFFSCSLKVFITFLFHVMFLYSITSIQRPPKGTNKSGHLQQLAFYCSFL